ncbi:MAG TPA: hypothetical protein VHU81_00250 [Thermoanaerobaculia bacterium]|nr:hypothetical protein [Thermoanaerobaculia bacterium]
MPSPAHKSRDRVLELLRSAGATRPAAAAPLADLQGRERRQLQHLIRRGVVHEVEPGTFYVEEAIVAADREIRKLYLILTLLVLWVGFLVFLLFH